MSRVLSTTLLLLASSAATAADKVVAPISYATETGLEIGSRGLFQYDLLMIDGDRDQHLDDWRRREINTYFRKADAFELAIGYDFAKESWEDVSIKLEAGRAGTLRVGQFKTPVGLDDGATSSGATIFVERALPESAIQQGRRLGASWVWRIGERWNTSLGYFRGGDLAGDNEGRTVASRLVYVPSNNDSDLLHLGLSASREWRDDTTARIRARPEVALNAPSLLDSGSLTEADAIDRIGLEGIWRSDEWSLQSEWLTMRVHRDDGFADFRAMGGYLQGSWVLTGEPKPYKATALGNPRPSHPAGAVELAIRYSALHLDDEAAPDGRQNNWTIGANWYLARYFKLQANYIRAASQRGGFDTGQDTCALRAQVAF